MLLTSTSTGVKLVICFFFNSGIWGIFKRPKPVAKQPKSKSKKKKKKKKSRQNQIKTYSCIFQNVHK